MIKIIPITSAGGTVTLDTTLGYTTFLLTTSSAVTLLASVNVVTDPRTLTASKPIQVFYNGDINLSGNTFTLVGSSVNQGLLKKQFAAQIASDGTNVTTVIDADDTELPSLVTGTNGLAVATSGTISFLSGINPNYIRVAGTTTASGNIVYDTTGSAQPNDWFLLKWDAQLTLGSNTLTIFGQSITAAEALQGNFAVFTWYDGLVWRSFKISGTSGLAGLGNLPARSIIGNTTGSSASATTFAATKNGEVPIMKSGTLQWSTLDSESFGTDLFAPRYAFITISQAQVLTSGVTPISLSSILPLPGSGLYYHIIDINIKKNSASSYTTNQNVAVRFVGAANPIRRKQGLLGEAAVKQTLDQVVGALTGSQIIANQTLELYTETGNPGGTGGDIFVEVFYTIKPY